jgi:ketosteroid isomerase-like protein
VTEGSASDDPHPFITAWRTRDVHSWAAHFAPDIVLRSPIIESTFEGSATAAELFGALFESFDAFEVTEHLANGQCHAFVWHGSLGRHPVEGIDRIRHNDDGSIAEITVYIRPLVGIATTATGFGPALAARRGRLRGLLTRATTLPLRALFVAIDRIATRLIGN